MELKRLEVRLPADHPLFDLPPRIRTKRAIELIQSGMEIAQLKQMIEAIDLKINHFAASVRTASINYPEREAVDIAPSGQFDAGKFLKSFE